MYVIYIICIHVYRYGAVTFVSYSVNINMLSENAAGFDFMLGTWKEHEASMEGT